MHLLGCKSTGLCKSGALNTPFGRASTGGAGRYAGTMAAFVATGVPMASTLPVIELDLVVVGGGVAGLWLINRLRSAGYDAVLLESRALGGEQSMASQGMIHGGIKYGLSGQLGAASQALAEMPERWRRCLSGNGEVDLRDRKSTRLNYSNVAIEYAV